MAEFTNLISEVHKTEISPNSSTSKPSRQIGIASNIAWLQFSDRTTSYLAHYLSALPWTEKQAILGKNAMGE